MKHLFVFFSLIFLTFVAITFTNCSDIAVSPVDNSTLNSLEDDAPPSIVPVDPETVDIVDLPDCPIGVSFADVPNRCLFFFDSFERERILGSDFSWQTAIMDNNSNSSNIDARIENQIHLGPIRDGNRALFVRGREGGSSHEVYLISKPFDVSGFETLVIEYRYLAIDLESRINFKYWNSAIEEGPRLDYCIGDVRDCGLRVSNDLPGRVKDPTNWFQSFPDFFSGRNLQIRDFSLADWRSHRTVIEVDDIPKANRTQFIFKITVALSEGYDNNNRENRLDDGLILDEVGFGAFKTQFSISRSQ